MSAVLATAEYSPGIRPSKREGFAGGSTDHAPPPWPSALNFQSSVLVMLIPVNHLPPHEKNVPAAVSVQRWTLIFVGPVFGMVRILTLLEDHDCEMSMESVELTFYFVLCQPNAFHCQDNKETRRKHPPGFDVRALITPPSSCEISPPST